MILENRKKLGIATLLGLRAFDIISVLSWSYIVNIEIGVMERCGHRNPLLMYDCNRQLCPSLT